MTDRATTAQQQTEALIYLGQRIDHAASRVDALRDQMAKTGQDLRESQAAIGNQLHERHNALPALVAKEVAEAVADCMATLKPLLPERPRPWEKHPYDWMLLFAFVWVLFIATGAAAFVGLVPDSILGTLEAILKQRVGILDFEVVGSAVADTLRLFGP